MTLSVFSGRAAPGPGCRHQCVVVERVLALGVTAFACGARTEDLAWEGERAEPCCSTSCVQNLQEA